MIARDGASISLWQQTSEPYITTRSFNPDESYDIIIAGGGITGVSTALLLQQAGYRCALLEAHSLCFGTSGGTTAHLNTIMDTPYTTIAGNFGKENARLVAQAAKGAIDTIQNNIAAYHIDCGFEPADAFLFAQNEKQVQELEDIRKASAEAGVSVDYTDKIPVPVDFDKAMIIKGQAQFHPVRYIHALAKAFEQAGGVIAENCRVMATDNTESLVVKTSAGELRCSRLIYATHIPPGVSILNLRCAPYRSYAMAVRLKNGPYPEGLAYDMYDPYHYYRTQRIDGQPHLIVGGEDHKTGHADNAAACFLKLESHIRSWFDVKEVVCKWSSQYFEPTDGLPYIGHMPGQPGNILVATGFGGNGMIYSTVAARLLADIILNRENPYTTLFDPNRIKPIAGFSNFVKENIDVVKQYVSGWLSKEKIDGLADIAPGEGKVVKIEEHTVAIYKDEEHKLHTINPTCTHLKCQVTWNNVEQSWDCPCHGARYDTEGRVLTGPADIDLPKIPL